MPFLRETANRDAPESSARSGSTSTAIGPGFIETRLAVAKEGGEDVGVPEQVRQMALMPIPLGRYGQPEDVAGAHLLPASDEADIISGVVPRVSGGQLGA